MYFVALATDYDGTLAHNNTVDAPTLEVLRKLRASGRRLLLVTGRELPDLKRVFPKLDLFDMVVAENGALIYRPTTQEEEVLGPAAPAEFVAKLRARGVAPLSVGRCIVATLEPNDHAVLETIHELGLELKIVYNKGSVMVLPASVSKATGLAAALQRLSISIHNVVGIGDAENDHAFLSACGSAVAVANAIPSLKERVDIITSGSAGAGVTELARRMIAGELTTPPRERVMLGHFDDDGRPILLDPRDGANLIAGVSGGGKSTTATMLLERFMGQGFQTCVIDPEGDFQDMDGITGIGSSKQVPRIEEVVNLLRSGNSIAINLLALDLADRPRFATKLLGEISPLRAERGRPHWLVIDEAHHVFPKDWDPKALALPSKLPATLLVTVHPDELAVDLIGMVTNLLAVGESSVEIVRAFCSAIGREPPVDELPDLPRGEGYLWTSYGSVARVHLDQPKRRLKRHARKYAEGELGEESSFYFRGPDGKLNLRAQNLSIFLQMAAGVDDETWLHHLHSGDYSRWFASALKDKRLASRTAEVEIDRSLDAAASRARVKDLVDQLYTAPAKAAG